jgi:hypothetical protein
MDPDIVRQQEEAEREARRCAFQKKETIPVPAGAILNAIAANALMGFRVPGAPEKGVRPGVQAQPPSETLPQHGHAGLRPSKGDASPWHRPMEQSPLSQMGKFFSYGLAGAMLGGGLGIIAANQMQLSMEAAKFALYGPAALFAVICALASFFTGRPNA